MLPQRCVTVGHVRRDPAHPDLTVDRSLLPRRVAVGAGAARVIAVAHSHRVQPGLIAILRP